MKRGSFDYQLRLWQRTFSHFVILWVLRKIKSTLSKIMFLFKIVIDYFSILNLNPTSSQRACVQEGYTGSLWQRPTVNYYWRRLSQCNSRSRESFRNSSLLMHIQFLAFRFTFIYLQPCPGLRPNECWPKSRRPESQEPSLPPSTIPRRRRARAFSLLFLD